jgi:hypothetical protein
LREGGGGLLEKVSGHLAHLFRGLVAAFSTSMSGEGTNRNQR